MRRRLNIAKDLAIAVDDFVTSTQAILAQKGKGKSYTASVQAEELLEAEQQVVVVDPTGAWWGLRSSSDGQSEGYPIAIFGGEHADVPLDAGAGEALADAIASEHFSAIVDLTLFRKGEALRFMAAFLETLYRKNREALHIFIDEADVVAPQKTFGPEQARVLGAAEDIVRRGRIRGIGCSLISQRAQVINKDVLSQVDTLTTLGMNHPKDLGAIDDWVAVHGDPVKAKAMIASLPSLPIGEAWMWSPASDLFKRVHIRKRRTFDSGKTPRAGERVTPPKVLADVDIQRLGAVMSAAAERAKENAPNVLRARIAKLEVQLAEKTAAETLSPEMDVHLRKLALRFEQLGSAWATEVDELRAMARELNTFIASKATKTPASRASKSAAPIATAPKSTAGIAGTGEEMPRMERAFLIALAQRGRRLPKRKLLVYTGYKSSGDTSSAFAQLVAKGWCDASVKNELAITDAGVKALGAYEPLPTGAALRELALSRVPKMEAAFLRILFDAYPDVVAKRDLLEQAGYRSSGDTSSAFAHLVALDYADKEGVGALRASEDFFV